MLIFATFFYNFCFFNFVVIFNNILISNYENITKYHFYSSFAVFIFSNLNISTIANGANTKTITSITFPIGSIGILNICLSAGINSIINISSRDAPIASNNFLLLVIPVLNIDFLLFLILNTCTSSDNANTVNAIA